MAAVGAGSTIVVTGTTVIAGPIQIDAVQNNATTSFTIVRGSSTILSGAAGTGQVVVAPIRSAGPITVTVVGGGSVTLMLAVRTNR